jgi:undecaprenyl diphosphate synthase
MKAILMELTILARPSPLSNPAAGTYHERIPMSPDSPAPADRPAVPRHIAIIMDGNGRWAKQRGLPRIEGHRRGVEAVRTVTYAARDAGVRMLTLYAFSAENWSRPKDEVGALMGLLELYLKKELMTFVRDRVRLKTIGRIGDLPAGVRRHLEDTVEATKDFTDYTLVLALNYGSRTEVVDAARSYASAVAQGREKLNDGSWEAFARHLYTAGMPDPDLVIRTSGESRMSNFLLMQAAYAEFYFTPVLWPDFGNADLQAAIADYARRERRYGLTSDQLKPAAAAAK